jgi:hypothetical protein
LSESRLPVVGRSAAGGRRALRESDRFLLARAPESPYSPRFEAELGELRENSPRQPQPRWFCAVGHNTVTQPPTAPAALVCAVGHNTRPNLFKNLAPPQKQ